MLHVGTVSPWRYHVCFTAQHLDLWVVLDLDTSTFLGITKALGRPDWINIAMSDCTKYKTHTHYTYTKHTQLESLVWNLRVSGAIISPFFGLLLVNMVTYIAFLFLSLRISE
jgi:hypothetical protein